MKAIHFVTGATGFVGSNLVLELLGQAETEVSSGGSLADPALTRGNDNGSSAHNAGPPIVSLDRVQSQSVHPSHAQLPDVSCVGDFALRPHAR